MNSLAEGKLRYNTGESGSFPMDNVNKKFSPPLLLTTSPTVVLAMRSIVDFLAFDNSDVNDILVTVTDAQGNPMRVTAVAGATTQLPLPEGGMLFEGGLKAFAASSGKITMWARAYIG